MNEAAGLLARQLEADVPDVRVNFAGLRSGSLARLQLVAVHPKLG